MDRHQFIKTCGLACIGTLVIPNFIQSCAPGYYVNHEFSNNTIKVRRGEFLGTKDGKESARKFVIVREEKLNFPIFLYQIKESEYSALWMECTHQGAELSAHGEVLSCASHGSEFDKLGNVLQGPAEKPLRKFKTTTDDNYIYIAIA